MNQVTRLAYWSRASTTIGAPIPIALTVSGWLVTTNAETFPGMAVALKTMGDPTSASTLACIVVPPLTVLNVKPTCAIPLASVTVVSNATDPSPIGAHATARPGTPLPKLSSTRTRSGRSSARATVSLCASPSSKTTLAAAPAVIVNSALTASVTPALVKRRRYWPAVSNVVWSNVDAPPATEPTLTPLTIGDGPESTTIVTSPTKLVATLPLASRTATVKAGRKSPAAAPAG